MVENVPNSFFLRKIKNSRFLCLALFFVLVCYQSFALNQLSNSTFNANDNDWDKDQRLRTIVPEPRRVDRNITSYAWSAVNGGCFYTTFTSPGNNRDANAIISQPFSTPATDINIRLRFDHRDVADPDGWDYHLLIGSIRLAGTGTYPNETEALRFYEDYTCADTAAWASYVAPITLTPSTNYIYRVHWHIGGDGGEGGGAYVDNLRIDFSPSGLIATLAGTSNVLTWDGSVGAIALNGATPYRVYDSLVSGGPYTAVDTSPTNSYTDNSPPAATIVYYVVTDIDADGVESPYSVELPVVRMSINDGSGADVDSIVGTDVPMNWVDVAAIAKVRYEVALGTSPGAADVVGWTDAGLATSYTFIGASLTNGTTYYTSVRIVTATRTLNASSSDGFTSISTDVRDGSGADVDFIASLNDVDMNWDNLSIPVSSYEVALGTSPGAADVAGWTNVGLALNHSFTGQSLTNGSVYYCSVRAYDPSLALIGTFASDGFAPAVSVSTTVRDGSGVDLDFSLTADSVNLNWDAIAGFPVVRYEAALGSTAGGNDIVDWTDMALATSGNLSGFTLTEGTTYYCSVRVVHALGTLPADSSDGFIYYKFEVRDGAGADEDFSYSPDAVSVNWDSLALGISAYEVAVGTAPGASDVVGWTNVGLSTSANFSGLSLANGTMYYCSVRPLDGGGTPVVTVFSDGFLTTILTTVNVRDGLGPDINFSYLEDRAEFNWDHPASAIIRYEVAVGTTKYGTEVRGWTDVGHANQTEITGLSLASGTRYFATVRGINSFGQVEAFGGSDGFLAMRDQVLVDTASQTYFHNARVFDNIDFTTDPGSIRPKILSNSGGGANYWRYKIKVTVTEPGVTQRINAPCRIQLTGLAGMANVREIRVTDEFGNEIPRFNLNTSVTDPDIVFLVNMAAGESRDYWIYWGNPAATDPAYGFSNNANQISVYQWTPYYSRKNLAPGMEAAPLAFNFGYSGGVDFERSGNYTYYRDDARSDAFNLPWAFYFFGVNYQTNWRANTNGLLYRSSTKYGDYSNSWAEFIGTRWGQLIAPLWIDLKYNDANYPQNPGVYRDQMSGPDRMVFTWRTNRYTAADDIYIFQAVLYSTSDIAFRYDYLSPKGVIGPGGTDRPVNNVNTVGLSNNDSTRWLINTPLTVGIGKTPTAFYQCSDAFRNSYTVHYPYTGGAAGSAWNEIAHFESMVFDSRTASPIWKSIEYDCSGDANNRLVIYTRSGPTPLPELGGWSAWAPTATVTAPGSTPISYTERYIQYAVGFERYNTAGALPVLNEVRFIHGGISIDEIIANTPDGVSQGQTGIPVEVKVRNFYSQPVDLDSIELTFSLGTYTQAITGPVLPTSIPAGDTISVFFTVDVDVNSPIGTATVEAMATATAVAPAMTFTDTDAQYPHEWRVRSKAQLVIKQVEATETFVNKGQTDIYVRMLIANLGETPFELTNASLTFTLGLYNPPTILQTPPLGTIIPELSEFTATFTVNIDPLSPSGVAIIGGVASGTSTFSGLVTEDLVASITDSWTIQNPAQMVLEEVVASTTVYRGQTNAPVFLRVSNQGEANAQWQSSSIIPYLSLGTYDAEYPITAFDIFIAGGFEATARYGVDISPTSVTGTSIVDASVTGIDVNRGNVIGWTNALIPGEWTILAEKVTTYKDAAFTQAQDSFNRPSAGTLTIYAKAENLNPFSDFVVRWIDPFDAQIYTSVPLTADASGTIVHQFDITTTSDYGNYKVRITNPINTVTSCENAFEVVSPAVLGALFSMPARVTVGQPFVASFTFDNTGGADIDSAYMSALELFGPGTALQTSGVPPLTNVPGNGQATVTYDFTAQTAGNFSASATAYGFDANSGEFLTSPAVTSNICIIESPPNVIIDSVTAVPTVVYLNQKNLEIQVVVRNSGQATAVLEAASMTFDLGSYQQNVISPAFPYELAGGGTTVTIRFDVFVDIDSPPGLSTFFANLKWYDKNWNENQGYINNSAPNDSWTIQPVGIKLSAFVSYDPTQDDFNRLQNVYVRAYGVAPLSSWYRIRFYNTQIPQTANSPAGWVNVSPAVAADSDGFVDHQYTLTAAAAIGTWSVVLENDPDNNGNTVSTMVGLQYFRVQNPGNLVASLSISPTSVFVGENFTVTMIATNTVVSGSTIENASPAALVDATAEPGFAGSATLLSGPDPASVTVEALQTKTMTFTYRADSDTGLAGAYYLTSGSAWYAAGSDKNTRATVYSGTGVSNPLIIYSRRLLFSPDVLDLGTVECGEYGVANGTVDNIGNYQLDHVKWITTDMNGPGSYKISKANLTMSPNPINALGGGAGKAASATLFIPYNKEAGTYIATMSVYNDRDTDDLQDIEEAYDLFNVKVVVPPCKKIFVAQDIVDLGAWPIGQTSLGQPVNYFSGGNIALDNVKFMQIVGTNTPHFPITLTPDNPGAMPITGSGIASAVAENVANAGFYIATWTVWNDQANPGVVDAGEASDTFQVHVLVGIMNFTLAPLTVDAGTVEPSGLNSGFGLTLTNDPVGLPLTRLKLDVADLSDGSGHIIASDNIAIYEVNNPIPATVAAGQAIPVDLALFVPAGTYAGTYTGTQYIYHDDNDNGRWDVGEFRASFTLQTTVPLVPKVQVMTSTVGMGGIAPGTSKIVSFSCRNTGNVDLTGLMWEKVKLVSGANEIPAANASFPPSEMFSVPIGQFFTRQIEVSVPAGQPYGVYTSIPNHFWLFADMAPTLDGLRSVGEASSTFVVTCEVGDLLVDILEANLTVSGPPNGVSTSATFNAKNIGSLALVNLKATGSVLIPTLAGPIDILASQNVFTPVNLGSANAGQTRSSAWSVNIPALASAGTYLGTVTVYEDSNNNNLLDGGEAFDTVNVELTVQSQPAIDVDKTLLDLGYVGKNNSKSGQIEITNVGNVPINTLFVSKLPLVFGANSIPVASISFTTSPAMPLSLAVGASTIATVTVTIGAVQGAFTYSGIQRIFEDSDVDTIWDAVEVSDTFELRISIGEKLIYETNLTNPPLDFGNRDVNGLYAQNVTVYSGSAVPLNRVKWQVLSGFSGTYYNFPIASLTFTPSASQFIDGFNSRIYQANADVGFVPADVYVATASFYDDDDNDGIIDTAEASMTFQIYLTVNPVYDLNILDAEVDFGTVAAGDTVAKEIGFQNTGNIQLSNFSWAFSNLNKLPDQILTTDMTYSMTFSPDPVPPGDFATTTVSIIVPAGKAAGVYGPSGPQTLQSVDGTSPNDTTNFRCEVINSSAINFDLASGSLSQEIATLSFSAVAPNNRYFMSAWICPGSGSAQLSFVTYNSSGDAVATYGLNLDSAGTTTPVNVADFGVSEKIEFTHPDHPTETLYYYRVYFAFPYTFDPATASNTRVILANTSPTSGDKHAVWFDGLQLERALYNDQEKPTSYHPIRTIFSPTRKSTITGEELYNEW